MKETGKQGIAWLLEIAGSYRILIVVACILSAVSAVLSLVPFVCIWFVIRDVFWAWPDLSAASGITQYGWLAVGFAVLSVGLYFIALMCSHLAAFRVEKNMRKVAMHKIVTLLSNLRGILLCMDGPVSVYSRATWKGHGTWPIRPPDHMASAENCGALGRECS
ncbi:hypothetical protein [Methanoregula sp.]|uniref:hypothetical protein n=1 Tax=Methanoregula sp. TaxID=2052170 RepID=UPI0026243BE5|nr:hypothetical protein [Methanoregula sp.]MDD5144334.1 hypothetical protein [Methanoregula sp.]